MRVTVFPGLLRGRAEVPFSKSYVHRDLIACFLARADGARDGRLPLECEDTRVTAAMLRRLRESAETPEKEIPLFAGECGTALRFMLPVCAALGKSCVFDTAGRLAERPVNPLLAALNAHGADTRREGTRLHLSGQLLPGRFLLPGDESSQYISGLLLALPLLPGDSELALTSSLQSAAYVRMTLRVLEAFGVRVSETENGWRVPGGQRYSLPDRMLLERDLSAAVFFEAVNRLGGTVTLPGVRHDPLQADGCFSALAEEAEPDVSGCPDLAPLLAVSAALTPAGRVTRLRGAKRLRMKESDRLAATARLIRDLGGRAEEDTDTLTVYGGGLSGGAAEGEGDHRIVMAAALAGLFAANAVTVTDAERISKSWPGFFETLISCGARVIFEGEATE